MKPGKRPDPIVIENRKARHEYAIEETIEAGLVLEGWEVKALRARRVHLAQGFARIHPQGVDLMDVLIEPLPTTRLEEVTPRRPRRLLLKRAQVHELIGKVERSGMTLVPLKIYETRGRFKLALGLARGKQQADKRQALKDRAIQRDEHRWIKLKVV